MGWKSPFSLGAAAVKRPFTKSSTPEAIVADKGRHKAELDAARAAALGDTTGGDVPIIAPPPSTDPYDAARVAAARQRKRAAGGSTVLTPGPSGSAARAALTPRTLVGG